MPWALPEDSAGRLALATGYPYDAPHSSYLFRNGDTAPLSEARFDGRRPILAHGSNRAPEQLRRKYGDGSEIPVTYAWLADYDVVFAAHLTRYGAIASTLHHAPGCRVRIAVTWLSEAQETRMHETEGPEYIFGALSGLRLDFETGPLARLTTAWGYLCRRGALPEAGKPLGLAAVSAEGRGHRSGQQTEALALAHGAESFGPDLHPTILDAIAAPAERQRHQERLRDSALPMAAPHLSAV